MTSFISFAEPMKLILTKIIASPDIHSKWLNTLSYLENCGAKKIAACEHPTLVKEEVLKHASEEFRHAHYLKRQIERVSQKPLKSYSLPHLIGGFSTLHYLAKLDLKTSRYLKEAGFTRKDIKEAAYLLVTYAIERRATELYPLYEEALRKTSLRVTVKSILLEEEGHLAEMEEGLRLLPSGSLHASRICAIESALCQKWLEALEAL